MGEGSRSVEVQLAIFGEQLEHVMRKQDELLAKMDGPPWERSVRGRLHALEAESTASKVASAALAEARRERRTAQDERRHARNERISERWKASGVVVALFAVLVDIAIHVGGW